MLNHVQNLIFEEYRWDDNGIFLTYLIDHHKVAYKIKISTNKRGDNLIDNYPAHLRHQLTPYIINTGIGLLSFMIKRYYPKYIIINAVQLDQTSLDLWTSWFTKGLGEFFYLNKLPHKLTVITTKDKPFLKKSHFQLKPKALLPNGGGKDSIVSSEILDDIGVNYTWVTVGLTSYREKVITNSSHNNYINISHLQYGSLPWNYKTYKGHFPYTLYTSCLICLVSGLTHSKYVVYSNEKSANYPNLTIREGGKKISINHQFTKSFEFEKGYSYFLKHYVNPELDYFSILRPLYEIQIAKIFSHFRKYHGSFVSCNSGKWCGRCSKCAFIYLSLFPYLETENLNEIIGNDMLNDKRLLTTYLELTGHKDFKPFECVGTIGENRIIMKKAIQKAKTNGEIPYIIRHYQDNIRNLGNGDTLSLSYNNQNMIPKPLKHRVKHSILHFLKKPNGDPPYLETFTSNKNTTSLGSDSYKNWKQIRMLLVIVVIITLFVLVKTL